MGYRIGIDAGSKTIKVVIADETGRIVHSIYRRHRFDIKTTVAEAVHDLAWRYGDIEGTIGITGSAGIGLASVLGLPFVQEVIATTRAVQDAYPQADAIIELGGEDAKVVYLTGGLEQRMNATCAGGTGGFIDTIAFMIGARAKDMSNLSLRANHIYPIASRCAVFAQTDVRPLLNAGASTADIAGSALEAVVRQTIGGLACGRPIEGTVVFLGGPLEHIPDLVRRFRTALKLDAKSGIKPPDAHLFTALGAALCCAEEGQRTSLKTIERQLETAPNPKNDLPRLDPLFDASGDIGAFKERHANEGFERIRPYDARGPLYLGIDAGSTAVKFAVIDDERRLVYSDVHPTEGDALATSVDMLEKLFIDMPKTYAREPLAFIAHATATGYGENLLRAALGVDSGVVETTAHVTAALELDKDLSFLLDIGGQDIKAIWVRDGMIEDAVLNEACSSGCGSFVEGTAYSLRSTPSRFSQQALCAASPIDLGTKCTVFMTSRIRHAQKAGASVEDLAAGAAYSVVRNALFRIIGVENLDSLGDHIVVQGGAFASDAVLRAFEKISNVAVTRPKQAQLMGAIGAALVARERAHDAAAAPASTVAAPAPDATASTPARATVAAVATPTSPASAAAATAPAPASGGSLPKSSLITREEARALRCRRKTMRCPGCENSCELSVISFGNGSLYVSGNRCDRAEEFIEPIEQPIGEQPQTGARIASNRSLSSTGGKTRVPNAVALEQKLLARYESCEGEGLRKDVYVGLLGALRMYPQIPFWHTLLRSLGFSIIMARRAEHPCGKHLHEGVDTIPSESVCYPAKQAHIRLASLFAQGATAVLAPRYERGSTCPVSARYPDALLDSVPALFDRRIALASPVLAKTTLERSMDEPADREAIFESLASLSPAEEPLARDEFDCALKEALIEQRRFEERVAQGNQRAIDWAHEPGHHGILLAGRPYHADPEVMHEIDSVLEELGFSVVAAEMLRLDHAAAPGTYPWKASKHAVKLARLAVQDPSLDLVYLESFNCGYDALSIPDAHEVLKCAHRPFTTLKIDDIADTAHIRIRLRTLAETIERVGRAQAPHAAKSKDRATESPAAANRKAAKAANGRAKATRVAAPLARELLDAARSGSASAFARFEQADIDTAHMHVTDVCFVVCALAGRAIRIAAGDDRIERIVVPETCADCLTSGLARIVERACGRPVEIAWEKAARGEAPSCQGRRGESARRPNGCEEPPSRPAKARPRIGLVGAKPLVFDAFLNDGIASFIEGQGFDIVLPDESALCTDDVRYLDVLERFSQEGVDHVVYLLSFGCLKGHVHARGALHDLAQRFPDMPLTIIDYDPEASALNRENRLRLALESVRQRIEKGRSVRD